MPRSRSLTYWGAKQRLTLLTTFRQRVVDYYEKARWDRTSNDWEGDADAPELRREINEDMRAVGAAIHFVGISSEVTYGSREMTGRVSLLDNIFNLPRLRLPHTDLIDTLDRAIGIYRSWLASLWRQVFNPFYWIGWGLSLIAEVPFRILAAAGFDAPKIEGSFWGKLVKVVIQLATALGAALGVLEKLDFLDPVVSAIHKLLRM